ncbi:MAG: hypothetical protein JNL58_24555 [Planctomyces sp.]|nr:hypothetical protein [Planctomyces sp.]
MHLSSLILLLIWFAGSAGCSDTPDSRPVSVPSSVGPVAAAEPVAAAGSVVAAGSGNTTPAAPGNRPADANSTVAESQQGAIQFRLSDDRPPLDESSLASHGLKVLRSKRLVLITDASDKDVAILPELTDQLFDDLEARLGVLPPAKDGSEFQVTGCLMNAKERFDAAGLLPPEDLIIRHGRHLNYRFWMLNSESDYYRRHLLFHEFVHCYMTCVGGMQDIPPLWYTEGIAEYIATHRLPEESGQVDFGILPDSLDSWLGWARISEIRRSYSETPSEKAASSGITRLDDLWFPSGTAFTEDSQYAHAWAVLWMINHHPHWREFSDRLRPLRRRDEFNAAVAQLTSNERLRFSIDWLLYIDSLIEGFDPKRCFADWGVLDETQELSSVPRLPEQLSLTVSASGAWQVVPYQIEADSTIEITASGEFTLGKEPRPWISHPEGITFDYFRGRPLGELIAVLVTTDGTDITRRIPIGRNSRMTIDDDCWLWLQLNESSAGRSDNSGDAQIQLRRVQPE